MHQKSADYNTRKVQVPVVSCTAPARTFLTTAAFAGFTGLVFCRWLGRAGRIGAGNASAYRIKGEVRMDVGWWGGNLSLQIETGSLAQSRNTETFRHACFHLTVCPYWWCTCQASGVLGRSSGCQRVSTPATSTSRTRPSPPIASSACGDGDGDRSSGDSGKLVEGSNLVV
jgi:hypothetical protein